MSLWEICSKGDWSIPLHVWNNLTLIAIPKEILPLLGLNHSQFSHLQPEVTLPLLSPFRNHLVPRALVTGDFG
jgi:hypothetical protein